MIATKIGYDFVNHGETRGRGQREIPHDFSPAALVRATDAALKRLKTDRLDLVQLHNIRMEQVGDNAIWDTMEQLKGEGKIRHYGIALGPAIGWLYEGVNSIRERNFTSVQDIYNIIEQHPGKAMRQTTIDAGKDTMFLVRVPHSSGMLEGHYTVDTVFPENDHRRHRPKSWLVNGVQKVAQLRFLETADRTLGQVFIAVAAERSSQRLHTSEYLRGRPSHRVCKSSRHPAPHCRRTGANRRAVRPQFRHRGRAFQIQRHDGVGNRRGIKNAPAIAPLGRSGPFSPLRTTAGVCRPTV